MTIVESGWNVWVWLVGVLSRRWVWVVGAGGIYGCGCKEVYRFPHTTYPYSSCIYLFFLQQHPYFLFINPRHACARVTVLVLSVCLGVCLCVCFPYSGTSRNQAYKQQYQRLQRDTGMKYKKGFFFKTLRSEVMASFTHLE